MAAETYGQYGRVRERNTATRVTHVVKDLTPSEIAVVADRRKKIIDHMPEIVPFMQAFHEAGAIDGWRNVTSVEVSDD